MSINKTCEAISAEVARLLREERNRRDISLNELSAKSGVSRQMISYVEQEERNPSLDTLLRITLALGVDLDEIIRRARKGASEQKAK